MSVRSHLPWPLRWAAFALMLGFSAAMALWAFEFGRDIAGLDRSDKEELARLRLELTDLRGHHALARQVADTADSLLKTERVTQERLALQVRQLEADKQSLQSDLGFYQRLLPTAGEGLQLRGFEAERQSPGRLRYQMVVLQSGKGRAEFLGRYELLLTGQREGRPWSQPMPDGPQTLKIRQVTRVEGEVAYPEDAVIEAVQVRVMDAQGASKVSQTVRL